MIMTIRFATPDATHHVTFGSLDYGKVFKFPENNSYYLKTPVFTHHDDICNCVDLTTGLPGNGLTSSDLVIPVTLEAKEVNA